jgi:hypothetical protein
MNRTHLRSSLDGAQQELSRELRILQVPGEPDVPVLASSRSADVLKLSYSITMRVRDAHESIVRTNTALGIDTSSM